MAIKATLAAALLVAMLALASATTFTTTVTTTSMDDENRPQCSQQVQGRPFRACQRYLHQSSPYMNEEEDLDVDVDMDMDIANPQQEFLQPCCQELKQMDRQQCGCEAIRHAVRQALQTGTRYQTGRSAQMYQRARDLPRRCHLRQQQCRVGGVFA